MQTHMQRHPELVYMQWATPPALYHAGALA